MTSSSSGIPSYDRPASEEASTTDVAQQQAAQVAGGAADAGKHVASAAADQAQQVAGEAKNQAKDLLQQTRGEVTSQAAVQQQRVAGGLHALAGEFGSMAERSENPGVATDLTRQAAQHAHTVASWLEDREPGQILDEVTRFARRKPGTFLALAAGAGLLAGRLGRGLTAATSQDTPSTSGTPRPASTADNTATAPIPPITDPPPGYGPGQHTAPPVGSGYVPESPAYPTQPGHPAQPDYPQPPAPGVTR